MIKGPMAVAMAIAWGDPILGGTGEKSGFPKPASGAETDALWSVFVDPPAEARASCYWWWKGDLASGEMRRQLRALKSAGLGGAHIIPWPSEPAYLSPEWLGLLREAADAAKGEGMLLDLSANALWPFRGDWVPLEQSLNKVSLEVHRVEGPARFSLPSRGNRRRKEADAGAASGKTVARVLSAHLAPDPVTGIGQMLDVTSAVAGDQAPGVDVPAGKHAVYVVRLVTGVKSRADLGRVPDHFDPGAIGNYLKGFADRVAPALGGRLGNGLRAMYCDSIEISESNWTPGFPGEFKRRCGYDLMPYLPLVLGPDARDGPQAGGGPLDASVERVRHDYCRTLVDLFLEGLGVTLSRWCHENGVLCRWQAYGSPWFYGIEDGYRIPDIPEGNNWLFSRAAANRDPDVHGWPVWQKYASSGAHQAGRRIASTEAATVTVGMYRETLDMLKRADDFNFVCGINHSFLHGFCYSPAGEPFPGRSQFGTYFSERNTWWPYMRRWMDYNSRLSAVLQSAKPVAQVALLFRTSDVWARSGLDRTAFHLDPPWAHQVWRWINQNGANADYVSDRILQEAAFEDGRIVFGPMRYEALVVLGAQTLPAATAEAMARYARSGGRIAFAGDVPGRSPGLQDAAANDVKVRTIVQDLLREHPGRVIQRNPPGHAAADGAAKTWVGGMDLWRKSATAGQCLSWADQLLTDLEVRRSVRFERPVEGLYHVHCRHDDGRDIYFFANTGEADVSSRATFFSGAGKRLEQWNPETAARVPRPAAEDGSVRFDLPLAGSLLLLAGESVAPAASLPRSPVCVTTAQEISGPWSAAFQPANGGAPFEIAPFPLAGLETSPEERLHRFAGTVLYRARFTCDRTNAAAVLLNLGAVANGVSEVVLNGRPLGVCWYGRHRYAANDALQEGENRIEVKIVTTLFNCLREGRARPEPSGLLGPVTLEMQE